MTTLRSSQVLFKLLGPDEEAPTAMEDTCLLFGLFGLSNFLLVWPGLFVLNALNVEPLEWPPTHVLELLFLNGVLDAVFNVLLVVGITFSSPLFVTCGTMLTIPASILWDFCFHGYELPPLAFAGVAMVIAGFALLNARCTPGCAGMCGGVRFDL